MTPCFLLLDVLISVRGNSVIDIVKHLPGVPVAPCDELTTIHSKAPARSAMMSTKRAKKRM